MTTIGDFLSSEQFGPKELIDQAKRAEAAGFGALWISDHFHPWNDEQGQSPFVWGVIGALSEVTSLPVSTAVTCPTVRTHPAIIAHAAATAAVQLDGRFVLGVGSDPEKHTAQVRKHFGADIDEVYVQQIGPDMDGFFSTWEREVLPALRG